MDYLDTDTYPNAQALAGYLKAEVDSVVNKISSESGPANSPPPVVDGLLRDTVAILDGIEKGNISSGVRRIVDNVLKAVEKLDAKFYAEECCQLTSTLAFMAQYGISIDGYNLGPSKRLTTGNSISQR